MTRIVLTYEDYAALPADGRRYELHDGEMSVTPAPGRRHQQILLNLALVLAPHVKARGIGELYIAPFDCIMTDVTVVEPDLLYVDEHGKSRLSERGLEGPPTLAVEIVSPSTDRIDRRMKMGLYARHGVTWYWIVDPDPRTIDAYYLDAGAYRLEARLEGSTPAALTPFPDLPLAPATIWP